MNTITSPIVQRAISSLFFITLIAFVPGSFAQTEAEDEDIYELSPFIIPASDNEGWTAGSTLIGTRTRTSLSELPISVDAITTDFMDDLGLTSLVEAAEWAAGLDARTTLETANDTNLTSFRGLETGGRENAQSSRNFFLWYPPSDTYNIERIDFNKGSNSLMFGDASPGGVATTYTKRAYMGENFGSLTARYGSYGSYRAMLDYNYGFSDNFALRVNLVNRAIRQFVDFWNDELQGGHIAGTYQPFENTLIRFEAEKLEFFRTRGSNRIRVNQRAGDDGGFAATSTSRQVLTSDGDYYDVRTEMFYESDGAGGFKEPYFLDRRNGPTGDDLPLADGLMAEVRRRDSPSPVFLTLGPIDPSLNTKGEFSFLDRDVNDHTLWVEQKIGDLYLEFAYNYQDQEQRREETGPTDTLNVDWDGRVFNRGDFAYRLYGNETNIVRVTAVYPLETKWFSQFLVANAGYQDDLAESLRFRLVNKAKAFDPETGEYDVTVDLEGLHRIRFRNYLDPETLENSTPLSDLDNWPNVPGIFEPIFVDYTTANNPFADKRYTRTASISASGEYFNGKLRSLFGLRKDDFELKRYQLIAGSRQELVDEYGELAWWGQDVYLGLPDEAPEQYAYVPDLDQEDTTYSAGLLYKLTNEINLYANNSTSFRWQGTTDFLGRALGPQTGETKEFGLKANLFNNLLVLDAAVYEVERANVTFTLGASAPSADELELLANDIAISIEQDGTLVYVPAEPGSPGFVEINRGFNNEHRRITAGETTKGYEFTAHLRRWNGLQVRLTGGYIDIESTRAIAEYAAVMEAALGREAERAAIIAQSWPNDPNYDPNGLPDIEEDLRDALQDGLEIVEANSGTGRIEGLRARPWRLSWVLDYEMPDGFFLPNMRVLLTGRYGDNYLLDVNDGIDWIGGSEHRVNLGFQYRTKLFDLPTTFQANIRNLTDFENDKIKKSGGFVDQFTDEPTYVYRNVTPTYFDFSINVKF
ncbi:MAG: TonB-dependent receptor plug domain-containing protein [Opitutae bacterium]|nr:TonB-dependent receptor plug domain-containing protein [Opitutae bacterium]